MCKKFICFDCRGKYGAWTVTDMEDAIDCRKNGDAGLNEVARLYNVGPTQGNTEETRG